MRVAAALRPAIRPAGRIGDMPTPERERGLRAPGGPLLDAVAPPTSPRRWSIWKVLVQVVGLAAGIALFAWAISMAFSPANRASLAALREAPAGLIAALLLLTALSIVLNGLNFWAVLLPLKRLHAMDVVATSAIATFISILPFKLSLLVRVAIHHRRDGVCLKDMLAWFAAMSALGLSVLIPLGVAGLWRGRIDVLWWLTAAGGAVLLSIAAVVCGRAAQRGGAWRMLHTLSLGADRIVRHPAPVIQQAVLRVADIGLLTARYVAAGAIANVALAPDKAVLFSTTYFLLSVLAPAGTLGIREGGVAGTALLLGMPKEEIVLITLIVTSAETIVALVMGAAGWIRLRPERYIWRARGSNAADRAE